MKIFVYNRKPFVKHPQYAHYDQQRFRPELFSDAAFSNSPFPITCAPLGTQLSIS